MIRTFVHIMDHIKIDVWCIIRWGHRSSNLPIPSQLSLSISCPGQGKHGSRCLRYTTSGFDLSLPFKVEAICWNCAMLYCFISDWSRNCSYWLIILWNKSQCISISLHALRLGTVGLGGTGRASVRIQFMCSITLINLMYNMYVMICNVNIQ